VEWSAEEFQWPGYEPAELYAVNKVLNEPDFPPLFLIHEVLLNARLMRHYKGRAKPTRAGIGMIGRYGDLQVALTESILRSRYVTILKQTPCSGTWNISCVSSALG